MFDVDGTVVHRAEWERSGRTTGEPTDEWTVVTGTRCCELCHRHNEQCMINLTAIEKWKTEVARGKTYSHNPKNTNCFRCKMKKKRCDLPTTEGLKTEDVPGTPSATPRKGNAKVEVEEVEVEMSLQPSTMPPEISELDFWRAALKLLELIDGRLVAIEELDEAGAHMTNEVLLQIESMLTEDEEWVD